MIVRRTHTTVVRGPRAETQCKFESGNTRNRDVYIVNKADRKGALGTP
jgi:hypothetical protein